MPTLKRMEAGERFMSLPQAAKFIGMSDWWLRDIIKNREDFPVHTVRGRFSMFKKSDLLAWQERQRRRPAEAGNEFGV